ncbi:MAG: pilus assembly protein [Hyphomicrobiales bacterium]|nr:pilus assembly protein [Hyphomicrobiales bacterium]
MSSFNGICTFARSFGATAKRLARSRQGVAAVEFALIAPILLTLYFVTLEVSHAIETNKKVGRAASMIADLITQQPKMTTGIMDPIMQIGEATLQPYNRSRLAVHVTGIQISNDETPTVTVAWSRRMTDTGSTGSDPAEKAGDPTTVPDELKIPGTFLVRVQTTLDYRPIIAWSADAKQTLGLMGAFDNINMSEQYYLRPRMSNAISCDDC